MRTKHEDQAGIDLKKNIVSNVCFNAVKALIVIMPKCFAMIYFQIFSNFDAIAEPNGRYRQ